MRVRRDSREICDVCQNEADRRPVRWFERNKLQKASKLVKKS